MCDSPIAIGLGHEPVAAAGVLRPEEGAPDQLMESAWFFSALDDATKARLSAIVHKAAS